MKPTIVNVYLVRGGDEWALIDTGMNSADSIATFRDGARRRSAARPSGCARSSARTIIPITSAPRRPTRSSPARRSTCTAPSTSARRASCPATGRRRRCASSWPTASRCSASRNVPRPGDIWGGLYVTGAPDVHIDDGDVIRVGDRRVEVVWTPGHAPGHCVIYLREQRVMIVGDHLLPKITPHVGFAPGIDRKSARRLPRLAAQGAAVRRRPGAAGPRRRLPRPPPPRQPDHPAPPGAAAGHARHRRAASRTPPTTSPAASSASTATARSPTSSRPRSRPWRTSSTCATPATWRPRSATGRCTGAPPDPLPETGRDGPINSPAQS